MLMFGMSFCYEIKIEERANGRYFAAKAYEKTTGDMSEPMGEFSLVVVDMVG
jgi:hypothetical protein